MLVFYCKTSRVVRKSLEFCVKKINKKLKKSGDVVNYLAFDVSTPLGPGSKGDIDLLKAHQCSFVII